MRALVVEELAPDYAGCALKRLPDAGAGPGEVLVEVRAAAVNFPDLLMTRGEYQHKPPLPFIPGLEMAGVVDEVGEGVDAWKVGDAVVGGARIGGFSEHGDLPVGRRCGASLSGCRSARPPASARPTSPPTSRWSAAPQARPGEWVLVHGAAGGVGLACVDLAKVLGCRVIAASASDAKLAVIARRIRARRDRQRHRRLSRTRSRRSPAGAAPTSIYDPVGGDVFDESVRCIAFDGRLLVVGFTSGRIPTISVNMPLIKGFSVMGVRAGEYGRQFPERGRENARPSGPWPPRALIRPRVHAELPLGALARRLRPAGRPRGDRQGGDPAGSRRVTRTSSRVATQQKLVGLVTRRNVHPCASHLAQSCMSR